MNNFCHLRFKWKHYIRILTNTNVHPGKNICQNHDYINIWPPNRPPTHLHIQYISTLFSKCPKNRTNLTVNFSFHSLFGRRMIPLQVKDLNTAIFAHWHRCRVVFASGPTRMCVCVAHFNLVRAHISSMLRAYNSVWWEFNLVSFTPTHISQIEILACHFPFLHIQPHTVNISGQGVLRDCGGSGNSTSALSHAVLSKHVMKLCSLNVF